MAAPGVLPPADWERLRALLDEALALPPAARASWLEQLPPEHAAWRERLAGLLAHSSAARPLLDTLPRVETADFATSPAGALPASVGPYRLLRELGRGGMARVWLAERTDMLQARQVALKLPYRDSGNWRDAALAERLAREREILATLEHPHIARLYDAGVAADGQPWLALEFVAGERIDKHAATLPLQQRLRLFVQAVRAVAHAHAQLVVHRDIKPANLLVTAQGELKLLDFGIAKLLSQGVAEATELTQQAGRAFTPQYASPEQIRGEPLGTATDIFSLGVVLYELLTGQRPFGEPGVSRAALEHAVLHQEPRRASEVAPAAAARALRGDLDTIVAKALKKRPRSRYATADALADDIERHLAHQPVLARPDSAGYRLRRFVVRNRLPVAAGVLVLAALGAGTTVALWQAQAARSAQAQAEAQARSAPARAGHRRRQPQPGRLPVQRPRGPAHQHRDRSAARARRSDGARAVRRAAAAARAPDVHAGRPPPPPGQLRALALAGR
jgi:eukaryotic-like serine/threonine-protein kinase